MHKMEEHLQGRIAFHLISQLGKDTPKLWLSFKQFSFYPHVWSFISIFTSLLWALLSCKYLQLSLQQHATLPTGFPLMDKLWDNGLFFSPTFLDIFTHRLLKAVFQYSHATTFSGSYLWAHHLFFNPRIRSRKSLKLGILKHGAVHILTGSEGGAAGHNLADIPLFLL